VTTAVSAASLSSVHHGDHDVLPAFKDERQRAVEVEQRVADAPALDLRIDNFEHISLR